MGKQGDPGQDDDLQHALEEAAEAATHDPDEANIAADDAGGTRLAEQMNQGKTSGTGSIRGKVGARPQDPSLGSISGTVLGKDRPQDPNLGSISGTVVAQEEDQQDPNLGSIKGSVAGKRTPPTTTRH